MITAVCHCAPPDNKPTPAEVEACRPFLLELLETRPWRAVLCLGGIAWTNTLAQLGARPVPKFGHGVEYDIRSTRVFGSYHPSQQNTFTGRLTEVMLDEVVQRWASY
jgi:uracil-DNA glycosylase family 4